MVNKAMKTIYCKVEIKSEQDLPKEDRRYYFHLKSNFDLTSCIIPSAKYNQIKKRIDWYLQPIEPQPTDEDIQNAANEYSDDPNMVRKIEHKEGYIVGATEMRDNKIYISPKK